MFQQPIRLLRLAGVLALIIEGLEYLVTRMNAHNYQSPLTLFEYLAGSSESARPLLIVLEQASIWGIAGLLWKTTSGDAASRPAAQTNRLLGVQLLLSLLGAGDMMPLIAAQVGLLLPGRRGQLWIAFQIVLQLALCLLMPSALNWFEPPVMVGLTHPALIALQFVSVPILHLLAYSLGLLGAVEARQRRDLAEAHGQTMAANQELQRVNAELKATQQMEAEAARLAERVSIARELHDALGHHLAGLSVNLQLATRLPGQPESNRAVEDAYLLARMLLSDVRDVVSDLRQMDGASLKQALKTIAASITVPDISLDFGNDLEALGPLPGHTLFRCAQEAITNAVRHAGARHVWISISRKREGFCLTARDDGRGATDLFYGHGLTGMRERVQEMGGFLRCETRPGEGFQLEVLVPEKGLAA